MSESNEANPQQTWQTPQKRSIQENSPANRKWEMSENERLLLRAKRTIKSQLLSPKADKAQPAPSPSAQTLITALNSSHNFFYFDEQALEKTRHIDTQQERRQMQELLQMKYNRVLLLEKEDKKACKSAEEMQRISEKMIQCKRFHQERLNQSEYARLLKENSVQQMWSSNVFAKNQLKQRVSSSTTRSMLNTQQKAIIMKQIALQTKSNNQANTERIFVQNMQQFNQIRQDEKKAHFLRLASADSKKRKAQIDHQAKCQVEQQLRLIKIKEYEELEMKEKQLLLKLQQSQNMLDRSVADLRKVITMPRSTDQDKVQDNLHVRILKTYSEQINNSNVGNFSQQLANAADNLLAKYTSPTVKMTTYQFPQPIPASSPSAEFFNQLKNNNTNTNQNHINHSPNTNKLQTSSTVIEGNAAITTREDYLHSQDDKNSKLHILLDDDGELQSDQHNIDANQVTSISKMESITSRKARSIADNLEKNKKQATPTNKNEGKPDPLAATSSSSQFKLALSTSPDNWSQRRPTSTKSGFQNSRIFSATRTPSSNFSMVCPPSNFQSASRFTIVKGFRV